MPRIKTYALNFYPNWLTRALLPLFLCVCAPLLFAQQEKNDSLLLEIRQLTSQKGFSVKDTVYIDLLNELATAQRFYNTDSLLSLSMKALAHSKAARYPLGESKALLSLGDYYSDKGNSKEAIANYRSSLEIAKALHHEHLLLRAQNNLAGEYGYKGDYANALNGYLEGLEIAEKYQNNKMRSIITENIASLYASQKDYEQALFFYKKVKRINETLNDEVSSAETFANMASIYADMQEMDYAMFNINSSISVFERHNIKDWLAYAYEVKGKIYLKQQKFDWALFWYSQSEMLHSSLEDNRAEIDLLNGIAETYLGLQKDSISQRYAIKAFEISTKINFTEGRQKCAKTLYKIHKNKQDYAAALGYHELYQQLSDTISRIENQKSLSLLKTKSEHEKQKAELILQNEKELATQRNYVNAALAILLIFIVVTYLVHRSEKIQKNLNEELRLKTEILEKNEIELKSINETKDKLFSIVAHDLRGPIGAFQGLLNLLRNGEIKNSEFMDFIPKLAQDIDHISFTLNNLLSWGQAQMNGLITKPSITSIDHLVTDNINLLSEVATNKSIKLVSHIAENTIAWTDSDQIDIVIRNLISNAIKFTPSNGLVTIDSREMNDYWEISVKDTGIGMDRETQEKIFHESSYITTYGTDNEKGTGLGLSLCKEMVEKNNGMIWVDSVPQQGTCFYFTVPKAKKQYQKAS
ncbi:tetratricopeptide repeat protein [Flavobacteriaceae bacterium TP-CH-4]|uniref:histidine kinase n=1 Tax=Pelagihabitans pacificus TaxID=2696054 RepID=A0A967E727_9FLAO|nr:ATP-binding protein [Pelagihabitans pacificus]NHF60240.1 tetratricopeptide repeat protein [Pelagihabitans pacificus]